MALIVTVPRLPAALHQLAAYLMRRDVGGPTGAPAPRPLEQLDVSSGGGLTLDSIAWEYPWEAQFGQDARRPDGFIVWWQAGLSAEPTDGGVRLSATARRFSMIWPDGQPRSYSVQAVRDSHQGEQLGERVQHDTWVGVDSP